MKVILLANPEMPKVAERNPWKFHEECFTRPATQQLTLTQPNWDFSPHS